MKYKITPLNIACGILLILAIYCFIKPGTWGFGMIAGIFLLIATILTLGIDFLFQNIFKKKSNLFIFEFLIIALFFLFYFIPKRTKTYIIPDNFKDKYIITVYDFPNKNKLPEGWNYKIKIPENGILFTSSKKKDDLRNTDFITYSGINVNSKNLDLGFGKILNDELICSGKVYEFTVWKVQEFCCGYTSDETKQIKQNLQKQICK